MNEMSAEDKMNMPIGDDAGLEMEDPSQMGIQPVIADDAKPEIVDATEDAALMEGVEGFVPMPEFWANKGYGSPAQLKASKQPLWFKDFTAQIDDDMSGAFDVEETCVGIFWLLSLVPDDDTPECKRGNGHCTTTNNVVEALNFLKPTFKMQFEQEEAELLSQSQKKEPKEQKEADGAPKKARLKKDYTLFGKQLQMTIGMCVRQRVEEMKEVNKEFRAAQRESEKERLLDDDGTEDDGQRRRRGRGGRRGGRGRGKLGGKKGRRAQNKIQFITKQVQAVLRGWSKAKLPSTGDKIRNIIDNIALLAVTPFHTFYDDGIGWKQDVADGEDTSETCKLVMCSLPFFVLKDILFAVYYYAMVFNFIWYHAQIYGEDDVTISFMEAWMPLIFVVMVDFLFVHSSHYETFQEEEKSFSDYQREMSMVSLQSFDRRLGSSQVSVVTICKDLDSAYRYEPESWADFSNISWWQRVLAALLSFIYVIIPGAWRASGAEDLGDGITSDGIEGFFGVIHIGDVTDNKQVPVVVINILVAWPAFCFLLLQLFVMNIDYANQLRQVKALSAFTSSKTARKFEKREEAFNNTFMPLTTGANIQGFMVARGIIREEGVPDGTSNVVPPLLLIILIYSIALIIKVFVDNTVDVFVILAAYLVVILLLFIVMAVLSVAQANTELKVGHLKLLLASTKALNQESQDEIDRIKAAEAYKQFQAKGRERQQQQESRREPGGEEKDAQDGAKNQQGFKQLAKALGDTEVDLVKKHEIEVNRDCLEVAIMEIQNLNEPIRFLGVEVDMALLFQLVSVGGAGAASSVASLLNSSGDDA